MPTYILKKSAAKAIIDFALERGDDATAVTNFVGTILVFNETGTGAAESIWQISTNAISDTVRVNLDICQECDACIYRNRNILITAIQTVGTDTDGAETIVQVLPSTQTFINTPLECYDRCGCNCR